MIKPFNKLSPEQLERLALLAEEAGEIVQIVGKIIRHGYESQHPFNPGKTNREELAVEIGHLQFAVDLMGERQDISPAEINRARKDKADDVDQWLHHNTIRAQRGKRP